MMMAMLLVAVEEKQILIRSYVCTTHWLVPHLMLRYALIERVDEFIVKSKIASNKLQDFETVSRGSHHRSNHTQKVIPSVVAGHQFLQFNCISPDNGVFPITDDTFRLLLENRSVDSFS